jgi:hypothetical protein
MYQDDENDVDYDDGEMEVELHRKVAKASHHFAHTYMSGVDLSSSDIVCPRF